VDRPGLTSSRVVTPDLKLIFLWLNLERPLDKRCGKMGVMRRRQLKKVITFRGDDTHQLLPRVTSTLVTPLQLGWKWKKEVPVWNLVLFFSFLPFLLLLPPSFPFPSFPLCPFPVSGSPLQIPLGEHREHPSVSILADKQFLVHS